MRYSEEMATSKPTKDEKKDVPVKAGSKDYDYNNLGGGRKIPTKGGWK